MHFTHLNSYAFLLPLLASLCPGTRLDLLRPVLWWVAGLFDYFGGVGE